LPRLIRLATERGEPGARFGSAPQPFVDDGSIPRDIVRKRLVGETIGLGQ
jgi:hypothetical protein